MIDYICIGRIDNVTVFSSMDSCLEYKIETVSTIDLEDVDDVNIANRFSSFVHDVREDPYGYVLISREEIEAAERKIEDLVQDNKELMAAIDELKRDNKAICDIWNDVYEKSTKLKQENEKLKKKICDLEADKTAECALDARCKFNIYSDKLGGYYCSHGMIPVMKCMNADHPCPFFEKEEIK